MKDSVSQELLSRFNAMHQSVNETYHRIAVRYQLSDCAFWILYTLRDGSGADTQDALCKALCISKQTVNSALKKLVANGLLTLESPASGEKRKRIRFTKKGEAFAAQTIDCVFELEREAFAPFTQEQWLGYLAMGNAYAKELRRRAELL